MLARAARAVARASAPAAHVRVGVRAMSSESAEFELSVPLEYHSEIRSPPWCSRDGARLRRSMAVATPTLKARHKSWPARDALRHATLAERPVLSLACIVGQRETGSPPVLDGLQERPSPARPGTSSIHGVRSPVRALWSGWEAQPAWGQP